MSDKNDKKFLELVKFCSMKYFVCLFVYFRYRWYILALFVCVAMMSNIGWNTWGPIEASARASYDWDKSTISLLANWGAFTFVIAVFPSSYILDLYGNGI